MEQLELNVIESFRHAKTDIIKIQSAINTLSRKQEEFAELLGELKAIDAKISEQMKSLYGNVRMNTESLAANERKLAQRAAVRNIIKKVPVIKKVREIKTVIRKVPQIRTKTIIKRVPQIRTVVKRVPAPAKRARVSFVASKESNRFHDVHCPFGKNIMPKTKLVFKTKSGAFNKGYKPCVCIRKY